jgi:hypothetical protein
VFQSRGLRLSLTGGAIFLLSVISLIFLPDTLPIVGLLAGGFLVWTGFIVTIFSYYQGAPKQPPPEG